MQPSSPSTVLVPETRPSLPRRALTWLQRALACPQAQTRPAYAWTLLLVPALAAVSVDGYHRAERIWDFSARHKLYYAATALESCLVWGALLYAAASGGWVGALAVVLFVLGFTFALGGQVYFFEQYRAYLTRDLAQFAANLGDSVLNQLQADSLNYLQAKAPFLALGLLLIWVGRHWLKPSKPWALRAAKCAPLLFFVAWFVPTQHRKQQASTPDTLYLSALGAFVGSQFGLLDASKQVRPGVRQSLPLPALQVSAKGERNVLMILTESVRADSFCSEYSPACQLSPHTNRLLPERHGLVQLRALDSTTAISLPVLWAGVGPQESRDVLHTWPLLFDYAKAAGYSTAYWTSQNPFFANARLFVKNLGVDRSVNATQLDSNADIDLGADEALLVDHVLAEFDAMSEPFFAMLHTSGTHYPYRVNPELEQPFQPARFDKGPEAGREFQNYYQNAIVQQDLQLARLIRHIRESDVGQRTVIVLTSDHGEAFRDHGQLGHTFSLFDEEIHVPAFIDAPAGTLTEKERGYLRAHRDAFTFHPDLTATTLDLMGVWHAPQLAQFRSRIVGSSLLGPLQSDRVMPMTNCAALWSCAFENWGAMQGRYKLFGRTPYDQGWQCYDLLVDPKEQRPLQGEQCDRLRQHTLAWFLRPPV